MSLPKLSEAQQRVLRALGQGSALRSHRSIDGDKVYKLHALHGSAAIVPASIVESLQQRRLIQSNQKFPAATFLLTKKGQQAAAALDGSQDTSIRGLSGSVRFD